MFRAIFGLIKGLIVGGGVGYGLLRLGWMGTGSAYLATAFVGALVGVVCGQPPWRTETIWTPVVKMIIGALIGAGLCALGLRVLPDRALLQIEGIQLTTNSSAFLAAAIGVIYGVFVEIDDGSSRGEGDKKKALGGSEQRKLKS